MEGEGGREGEREGGWREREGERERGREGRRKEGEGGREGRRKEGEEGREGGNNGGWVGGGVDRDREREERGRKTEWILRLCIASCPDMMYYGQGYDGYEYA